MNTTEKIIIIDSDPQTCGEIKNAMMCEQYSILTASNYEEALGLISSEDVTRIILGSHAAGADSNRFVQQLNEQNRGKQTIICHMSDTDRAVTNFPAGNSALTQFAVSRTSDIQLMKEKFRSVNNSAEGSKKEKVDTLLDEVFGALKDYTTEMCDSIRYARQIQKALLPGEHSLKRIMDCFVFNSPKNIVSGDFFWYTVRFNRVILAVADCTGHGVPAALMSIIGHDTLNSIVNEQSLTEPAQILKQLNMRVHRVFENQEDGADSIKDGMDLAVISIDPSSRTIEFAGARRPLTAFLNGEFVKIKGDLHCIGIHTPVSAEFKQHRVHFGPQDVIYLGSDGYADQFGGPHNKKMGSRKFEQFLTELHPLDTTEQKKSAETFFQEWKTINEQTDDVLLLGIKPGSLLC